MSKFKKGSFLIVTNNRTNKGGHTYHCIPIGSVVEVINSEHPPTRVLGTCYYVWSEKENIYQYIYEGSLRLFAPPGLSKGLDKEQLPDF